MTNETLKTKEQQEITVEFIHAFFGQSELDKQEVADWWLAKLASHDALLLRRLEEDLNNGKFYAICSKETTLKDYIKLLITNKQNEIHTNK